MKLPPFLLAAAVLFWGWQAEHEVLALFMALVFEACRKLGQRTPVLNAPTGRVLARLQWDIPLRTLGHISNLCSWVFVAMSLYFLFLAEMSNGILSIIRWVPFTVLPLVLAIQLGGMETIRLSTISGIAHKKSQANPADQTRIDIGLGYVCMWLLAAGVSNRPGPGFYTGLLVLAVWIMWQFRPRHGSKPLWLVLMLIVGGIGALFNQGLYHLQGVVEQSMMDMVAHEADENPNQTATELGHIGKLKLSGSVLMQVNPGKVLFEPLLLKTAAYNTYGAPSWLATGRVAFRTVLHVPEEGEAWHPPWSGANQSPDLTLEVSATANRVDTVLALPLGLNELASAQFLRVVRNPLGSVRVKLEPGFYSYRARYSNAVQYAVPMLEDMRLPREDKALVQDLVQQLGLPGKPAAQILPILQTWFAKNYRYSTTRAGNAKDNTALADFLTRDRRGHCEHFATATVLMLRAAGVPARYAVGYSVQEPNRFGPGYLVRKRHAHAWAEVYVDGVWENFDTTPPVWGALERDKAGFWEPVQDAINGLLFQLRRLSISRTGVLWAGGALLALIVLRSLWQDWQAARKQGHQAGKPLASRRKVADTLSALAQIETLLAARGLGRPVHESLLSWQARIAPQLQAQPDVVATGKGAEAALALAQLIRLHYRCRFGPLPVSQEEEVRLQAGVRDWIAQFGA